MENVRIRVRASCEGTFWDYAIWFGKKNTRLEYGGWYRREATAVKAAKAMAKRLGIKYDPKIKKDRGC